MRRPFAVLLLFFAVNAVADALVPFDLVKAGTRLLKTTPRGEPTETNVQLRVRGIAVRGEVTQRFRNDDEVTIDVVDKVEYRSGTFQLRFPACPHMNVTVDLDSGIPLKRIDWPFFETAAIALSKSHYLLSVIGAPAGRDFELTWQPDLGDLPEMALFTEGNDGLVMILSPLAAGLTNVELRFDDPAADVRPGRVPDVLPGDLVVVAVKFGNANGRVFASGRISGQQWQNVQRVGEDVCVLR